MITGHVKQYGNESESLISNASHIYTIMSLLNITTICIQHAISEMQSDVDVPLNNFSSNWFKIKMYIRLKYIWTVCSG